MASTDIIARLKLNAEQFNAESRRALAVFETTISSMNATVSRAIGTLGKVGGGIVAGVGGAEIARQGSPASLLNPAHQPSSPRSARG